MRFVCITWHYRVSQMVMSALISYHFRTVTARANGTAKDGCKCEQVGILFMRLLQRVSWGLIYQDINLVHGQRISVSVYVKDSLRSKCTLRLTGRLCGNSACPTYVQWRR